MLVLTRKVDQAVMIGDNIEIVILSVQGNKVRLGFHAPHSISIRRAEAANENSAKVETTAESPVERRDDLVGNLMQKHDRARHLVSKRELQRQE